MIKRVHVTNEMFEKIWLLHEKGLKDEDIAEVIGVSKKSVFRIVTCMMLAQKRDIEALNRFEGVGNIRNHKEMAMKFFGLKQESSPEPKKQQKEEPVTTTKTTDNTALFCVKVFEALNKQNELLEKLCSEFGIEP